MLCTFVLPMKFRANQMTCTNAVAPIVKSAQSESEVYLFNAAELQPVICKLVAGSASSASCASCASCPSKEGAVRLQRLSECSWNPVRPRDRNESATPGSKKGSTNSSSSAHRDPTSELGLEVTGTDAERFVLRPLQSADGARGFLTLLEQLTVVGTVTPLAFHCIFIIIFAPFFLGIPPKRLF